MREVTVLEAVRGGHSEAAPERPPLPESRAIISRQTRSELGGLKILNQILEQAQTDVHAADGLRMRP